ncbi:CapA family protein [Arthrobacter ginkgonis]|uniref:CapA family protein n=1 Tax=Arthrobacter ginkgonis TaxID=1630594 RepID=UPI0031EFDDC0
MKAAVVAAALAAATTLSGCTGPGANPAVSNPAVSNPAGSEAPAAPGAGEAVPGTASPQTPASEKPAAEAPTVEAPGSPEGADCAPADCVDVVVTGDVLLHPALWEQAKRDGGGSYDFRPLLSGLRPFLVEAELAVCNLETPLAPQGGPYSGYPSFTVPPQIAPALKATGYDACTTASNHTVDAGTAGVERTLDTLDDAGLAHTGSYRSSAAAARPLIVDAGGARIAIVAATYGLNGLRADTAWRVDLIETRRLVAKARQARAAGADIVLAALHDGVEYSSTPSARQVQVSRALAESGEFDFVYGHHTHSVLPLEKHAGVWIAYGLGNSVAAHATDLAVNREGLTVKLRFTRAAGGWQAGDPRWAAHIMARSPARWCALPAADPCTGTAEDAASLARTTATVNARGADDDGAAAWVPGSAVPETAVSEAGVSEGAVP